MNPKLLKRPIFSTMTLVFLVVTLTVNLPQTLAQDAPEAVVETFLQAWVDSDYEAMYALVHSRTKQATPLEVFQARYQNTADTIALNSISFEIHDSHLQGQSAAVDYDVIFESGSFGTIEDSDRIMRLVKDNGNWRIAWSSMDIFDMLAGSSELRVQARPQQRAAIYDRNGFPLAQDGGTMVAMYSAKQDMLSEADCIATLWDVTLEPINNIQRRFANLASETRFWLGAVVTERYEANSGRLLENCGVDSNDVFVSAPLRTYLGGNATAHVTGYIGPITAEQLPAYRAQGYTEGELVGQAGVEWAFQQELAGVPERVLRIVEPGGVILRELASLPGTAPTSVQLTIDRDLQLITAKALSDAFNYADPNWGDVSPGGAAIVLDINSGEILALASYPLFDPALFNPSATAIENRGELLGQVFNDPREPLRNRAIAEQQSPGSVFKIITATAVLNEGVIGPDDIFDCPLEWDGREFGDTREFRQDWRAVETEPPFNEPAGNITPAQAITASCNPFFWQHGAILFNQRGSGKLNEYARRMGLAQRYDLDGIFAADSPWPEAVGQVPIAATVDAAISEAIGQGDVTLPPLQMSLATMTIGNGGTLYEPYLVKQVGGLNGTPVTYTGETNVLGTLDLNAGVLETVQEGMCGVITNRKLGTAFGRFNDDLGWVAFDARYTLCGKTGTAQTAQFPNAWFVAYAPAENPEIAVVVTVEQSLEGSQVAAPIVRRILDQYFGERIAPYPEWWNIGPYIPLAVPEGNR